MRLMISTFIVPMISTINLFMTVLIKLKKAKPYHLNKEKTFSMKVKGHKMRELECLIKSQTQIQMENMSQQREAEK